MALISFFFNPKVWLWLAILCLLAGGVYAAAISFSQSHGVLAHGTDALAVRTCLNQKGPLQVWWNAEKGYKILVCRLDNGMFGLQVLKKVGKGKNISWSEVTAYIKDYCRSIEDVGRSLAKGGATLLK
jgi:hypothetical protein